MRGCSRMRRFAVALLVAACSTSMVVPLPARADADFELGLRLFKAKRYLEAAKYFDKASSSTPWESGPLYYSALSYHYGRDYKHAIEKYDGLVSKFPGTSACNNAMAALKVVDPGYFKRRESSRSSQSASSSVNDTAPTPQRAQGGQGGAAKGADRGTVEGDPQTRVYFTKQGDDKLVDVRVGGRSIRVRLDEHSEDTAFTKGQLAALGIQAAGKEVRAEVQLGGVVRKNFPITVDDSVGANPKIGNSFLNAFVCDVDNAANFIDLRRKDSGSGGGGSAGANQVSFKKEGKDVIVNVDMNGRSVAMVFDPNGSGVSMSTKSARAAGLKVDDAEDTTRNPADLPQRGEPGWVPPDERPAASKNLTVQRMRFGPVDRSAVQVQVIDKDIRYPKIGADFVSGGWKFDIDYQANVIRFRR